MPTKDEIFIKLIDYIYDWKSMGIIPDSDMKDVAEMIMQYYLQCTEEISENP